MPAGISGRSTASPSAPRPSPERGPRAPGRRRPSAASGRSSGCAGSAGSTPPAGRSPGRSSTATSPAGAAGSAAASLLPFAMALVEYDLQPQRLALDIASGAVDLGMEAELLRESDRRAVAEEEARRLAQRGDRPDRCQPDRPARAARRPRRPAAGRGSGRRSPTRRSTRRSTRPAGRSTPAPTSSRSRSRSVASWRDRLRRCRPRGAGLAAARRAPARPTERRPCPDRQPAGPDRASAATSTRSPPSAANYVRLAAVPPALGGAGARGRRRLRAGRRRRCRTS